VIQQGGGVLLGADDDQCLHKSERKGLYAKYYVLSHCQHLYEWLAVVVSRGASHVIYQITMGSDECSLTGIPEVWS
jgi:hypothetical protein